MTLEQAADANDRLPEPRARLSEKAIKGYLAEVRSTWSRATADVADVRDIGALSITMPRSAAPSVDREGLRPDRINPWLADAARRSEPHFRWLPLVGLITGMRLGEIVYLKGGDFTEIDGHLVIDLRCFMTTEPPRPLKTKTSRRLVALHPILGETGFLEWARSRGTDEWVFPDFHRAKDPADAAQKRMSTWMRRLGIHTRHREVFHSLRHSTKAWLRPRIGKRSADFLCGHASTDEGDKYGFRLLEPEEIAEIEKAGLPRGVDFSPYLPAASVDTASNPEACRQTPNP